MTVKERLERIKVMENSIEVKQERLETLRAQLTSIQGVSISETRVQTSRQGDSIGERIGKIDELQQEIAQSIDELISYKVDCIRLIDHLERVEEMRVLYARYLDHKSISATAKEMSLCVRSIQRIQKVALEKLEKIA